VAVSETAMGWVFSCNVRADQVVDGLQQLPLAISGSGEVDGAVGVDDCSRRAEVDLNNLRISNFKHGDEGCQMSIDKQKAEPQ